MSKTVEIQRQFTPLLIKGRMFNAQYDGKVPPSNERDKQIGKVIFFFTFASQQQPIFGKAPVPVQKPGAGAAAARIRTRWSRTLV